MQLEHEPLETCADWLPKPKRKYKSVVVQCEWCKKLYVGDWWMNYRWEPLELPKDKK